MINKLFGTFVAKVAVVAVAGGFATGGLVAAGAFTGGVPPHEAAHVAGATAITLATSSTAGVSQAAVEATSTPTVVDPEDHHEATSTVKPDGDEHHSRPTATVTPKPTRPTSTVEDNDADDGDTGTAEASDPDDADDAAHMVTGDHGNCVAYAVSVLRTLGLAGEQNGAFISLVARDKTAVTARVAAAGTPDAACATAIAKAKVAALAAAATAPADDHGQDAAKHDAAHHDGANHGAGQHQGNDDKGGVSPVATTSAATGDRKGGRG